ncbi:hypothetical protein TUM4438_45700 [Shewanella sairae]|uniref:Uncharacterized protein n=1 Tax=Shewanella sairae TaxID=190310 RepID=A0ABQ4PRV9_9GAMM|nr:hypothetical protein [Shewanella sairae]MCL1132567.1 hypothetical protein [Shewanella sairae]GIU52601.1 hypothetical protein TUM4438_45700 [Shewanella sairae]
MGLDQQQIYKAIFEPKSKNNALYKRLKDDLGFMPSKPKLAKDIADLISDYNLVHDLDFIDNEVVKFIKFLEIRATEIQLIRVCVAPLITTRSVGQAQATIISKYYER